MTKRSETDTRIDLRLTKTSTRCYIVILSYYVVNICGEVYWDSDSLYLYESISSRCRKKSLFAFSAVVGLALLTWNKATEIVREVADFESTAHTKLTYLETLQLNAKEDGAVKKMQHKIWKDVKNDTLDLARTVEIERIKNTTPAASSLSTSYKTSTVSLTTDVYPKQTFISPGSSSSTRTLPTTTTSTETKPIATLKTIKTATTNEYVATKLDTQEYERKLNEKYHVAFLKVHKTGSSTVQNLFLRFGDSRNLTFILAHDDIDKAETKFPNMISYSNSLTENNIVPPPDGRHFEILCCHVIYNRIQFEKFLPADTAYIGLVREPVARLESSFRYFNLYPNVSLSDFAASPLRYDKGLHSMSNNRMSYEFGFPLKLFPNSNEKPENLQQEISKYIEKLLDEFDLIMINEKMDESLVLMKRILNWHVKDILYMKQLVAKHETRRFTDTDIKHLKTYLYLDYALYEAAKTEFEAKIEKFGPDFRDEVDQFKQEIANIHEFCSKHGAEVDLLTVKASKWDSAYNVTLQDCSRYTKFEIKFIQDIRMKQYGRLGI